MARRSLAEQYAELDDPTPKDFDPEDLERAGPDSDDDESGRDVDENAGREHYQAVGKAKLRKQDPITLGKQYAGSKVSRDALEAESDDDPFKARSGDEESDSDDDDEEEGLELGSDEDDDEGSEESEEEAPKKSNISGKKGKRDVDLDMETDGSDELEGSEEGSDEDELPSDMDDDDDDEDDDEEEDDEDEDESEDEEQSKPSKRRVKFNESAKSDDRDELRRLMATDQKSIAATISQAAKSDAIKGKAVKQQRATFDALLNTRIKLQKGLTVINQLSLADQDTESADGEAIKSAESAALALWSTLEDLRLALADAHSPDESKKRKRPSAASPSTSSASLWKRMTDLESDSNTHRRAILDKWSSKVRGSNAAAAPNARGKLLGAATGSQQTITAVLDAQVASETGDRAAKRARASNGASEDREPVYDDTIFYQSLLRDLVEQRMSSSDAITNGIDTLHIQLPSRLSSIHPVTGMRKDKVKRDIDTRASKGRKMKFDVHEKLQNFMAPEDRGSWTTHAREEFFASLLGKTASGLLGEDDEEDASGAESDEDREEGGLRLFRS
ncbi:AATF family protein [Aspergillus melleus]|uniref:AATF family protein n=1 Tax=Aspergillus melleus TaxID=138277 RepID=UPI001E8DFD6A|nr:rRNA-processing protein bfr2 [Aspergillus melleus]KAH8427946.1 rRNA-processing protein bfr2 [Aspergillus melleus]